MKLLFTLLVVSSVALVTIAAPAADGLFARNCKSTEYVCKPSQAFQNKCVSLNQLCDQKKDCPQGDDEDNELCQSKQALEELFKELEKNPYNGGLENDFSGTGFMFSVNNLVIDGGSNVKMFNQNSDNTGPEEKAQLSSNL